jgi:flagellar biosynthesis/type III secretory pathway protein FliH
VEAEQKRIANENPAMSREQAREKAIADSISYCKKHKILKNFFENLSPEEVNMLTTEWNLEDAIKVAREEGREDGWEECREKYSELFSSLINEAKSMDDLKKMFETTFTRQS